MATERSHPTRTLPAGEIEIKKRAGSGQTLLKVVNQPNDFFGEMALIDRAPRSATAVAAQDTIVLSEEFVARHNRRDDARG